MAISTQSSLGDFTVLQADVQPRWQTTDVATGSSITVKFAHVALTADGPLVAAVSGKKIRVHALYADSTDVDQSAKVYLEDGTTQIGPEILLGGILTTLPDMSSTEHSSHYRPFVLDYNEGGWCETSAGAALNVEIAGTISDGVDFMIVYSEQ
jgi:hypothetical protein